MAIWAKKFICNYLLNFIILQTRFVFSVKLYIDLSKLLELDFINLAPLSQVLDTSSTPVTQPYFFFA